jgi:3-hydroxy-9,10-secoandrosta-1,3,5(10)-triene-9,17-dione monooxygenase reductase component
MTSAWDADPSRFRYVLGHYPTGVVAITAIDPDGAPVGMAVGTFASVSLSPPLVTFFADHGSTTWPVIRAAGAFCANVLSGTQHRVCQSLSRRGGDKFADLDWSPSEHTGSPLVRGAAAWADCRITAVHRAGDHDIVIGEVLGLDLAAEPHHADPLVFFRGGYSRLVALEADPV